MKMELVHRDGLARIGKFKTKHGTLETPTVLPVINPNKITITPDEMKKLGAQGIITNSYIIRRTENLREKALKDGVHSLISFDGPIMTDSGTFQSYVYGDVEYDNLEIVDFQRKIGSDIPTILDIFSTPEDSYEKAKFAVEETHRRMGQIEVGEGETIAGPVQGSIYPDLREKAARLMSSTDARYLPVGGVVPLLESYQYDKLVDVILTARANSDFSKPIHLFGGGHPMFMAISVLLGVDLFDSASYVKYARDGRMLYPDGTRDLKKLRSLPMWSPLYDRYTVKELIDAKEEERIKALSRHNLAAIFNEISEIKERIFQNTLWQYAESRARSHPYLFKAFRRLLDNRDRLSVFEPLYRKSSFYYFDRYSNRHPSFRRLEDFTRKYVEANRKETVVVPFGSRTPGKRDTNIIREVYEKYDVNLMVPWCNTYVPVELEDTYPFEQIISSDLPEQDLMESEFSKLKDSLGKKRIYTSKELREPQSLIERRRKYNLEKIRTVADMQFGSGVGSKLFPDGCEIITSRATGRLRNIILEGDIIATMRAQDGFFTLTVKGGERIRDAVPSPGLRVIVTKDSAEYNAKGFNVFFKFITEYDHSIIASNETLVVDSDDNVVAVGRATVSGREMGDYRSGVAVKTHHSISSPKESSGD